MASLEEKLLVESIRAAALACHSTSGMALGLRRHVSGGKIHWVSEVSRLMRSAEAMCRSAVALVSTHTLKQAAPMPAGDGTASASAPLEKKKKKKRGKKRSKSKGADVTMDDGYTSGWDLGSGLDNPSLVTPDGLASLQQGLLQALGHGSATAASQAPCSSLGNANTTPFFPVGTVMFLKGLASRPELNGQGVTVSQVKEGENNDRVPVLLNTTGERLKVKPDNLVLATAQPQK